jgi:DNA-binding transcriptional LysR family regulator
MRFDLVDLRLFLNVVEAASITRGAERANLALPSASARIRGMEEAIGVRLLERGRRGIRPTPAGQALVHHARVVLQQVEQMRGELTKYARGLKGFIRLLANTVAVTEFLPEPLASYLAANPNINIDLEERLSYEIVQAVAAGNVEMGIVADTVDLSGLETFPFRVDRLVLVTPADGPFAGRQEIAFSEIFDHEFVGLSAGSALQNHLDEHALRAGQTLKFRVRVRGFEAVCRMVEHGVGLGIVPETAAERCRKAMAIRAIRLSDPWALRNLTICVRRLSALPAYTRSLIQHLTEPPEHKP